MLTDLFGAPLQVTQPKSPKQFTPRFLREEAKRAKFHRMIASEKKTRKFVAELEGKPMGALFIDVLDYLKLPLVRVWPGTKESERASVALQPETGNEVDGVVEPDIPYEAWGAIWVVDRNGLSWSQEAIGFLQVQVFWESLEELGLHNNEHEKWSVLKWVFMPAIRKYYVYDKRINRSHCLEVHERDEAFSFHNCAIAAKMDADQLRDMLRARLAPEVFEAVKR